VAATELKSLQLWPVDSATAAASAALPGPIAGHFAALATDGQRVVAVTQDPQPRRIGQALDVRIWNSPGLAPVASHPLGRNRSGLAADLCALAGHGSLLAVHTAGSRVTVRQADSERDIGSVDEAGDEPLCAFSADGRMLAVGTGTVRVWDIATQTQIATLEVGGESSSGENRLRALAFSPNGHRLAVLQRDGTVSAWLLDPDKLLKQACLQLSVDISIDDWARFVGSEPRRAVCANR
jgi:WD40 repeat protein